MFHNRVRRYYLIEIQELKRLPLRISRSRRTSEDFQNVGRSLSSLFLAQSANFHALVMAVKSSGSLLSHYTSLALLQRDLHKRSLAMILSTSASASSGDRSR